MSGGGRSGTAAPPRRLVDVVARDPWLVAALVALAVATVAPLWSAHYLPLRELPARLSGIAVWHHYHDAYWDISRHYELNRHLQPGWAYAAPVHLLAYLTRDIEAAHRLFLAGWLLALPLGALALAGRTGRSPWLALLTFPLAWNIGVFDGALPAAAGLALLPWALVVADRHDERPTWLRALAVGLAAVLLWLFHPLPYWTFLAGAGLWALLRRDGARPRTWALRLAPLVACAALGLATRSHAEPATPGDVATPGASGAAAHGGVAGALAEWPDRLINVLPGARDEWVLVALLASWLALAVTCARAAGNGSDEDDGARGLGLEACFVAALAAGLFLRQPAAGGLTLLATLFGLLLPRGRIAGARRLLLVPALIAGLWYPRLLARAFHDINIDAAGFDEIVAEIPRARSVLTLMPRGLGDINVNTSPFDHWAGYVLLRHGGFNPDAVAGSPARARVQPAAQPSLQAFDWGDHARGWDYFLVFREGWIYQPMSAPVEAGKVKLVSERGAWRLYRKAVPDPPRGANADEP